MANPLLRHHFSARSASSATSSSEDADWPPLPPPPPPPPPPLDHREVPHAGDHRSKAESREAYALHLEALERRREERRARLEELEAAACIAEQQHHESQARRRARSEASVESPTTPSRRDALPARPSQPRGAATSSFDDATLAERTARWRERVATSTEMLRRDLEESRERECTFSPTINHRHPPTHRQQQRDSSATRSHTPETSRSSGMDDHNSGEEDNANGGAAVFDRLHATSFAAQRRLRAAQRAKADNEASQCTFRPRLVQSAWTAAVQPRYLDTAHHAPADGKRRRRSPAATSTTGGRSASATNTSTPSVVLQGFAGRGTAVVHHSAQQRDSVDDLQDDESEWCPPRRGQQRREEESGRTSLPPAEDFPFMPVVNQPQSPRLSRYLQQPVHERLNQHATTAADQQHRSSSPPAGVNSKRRTMTPSQRREFEQRLQDDVERRKQRAANREQEYRAATTPTFQPYTSRHAKLDAMTPAEREALLEKRRARARAEREAEQRAATPTPVKSFVTAKSKVILAERPLPNFQTRVHEAKQKHDMAILERRAEQEAQELAQCRRRVHARRPPDDPRPLKSEVANARSGDFKTYVKYVKRVEARRRKLKGDWSSAAEAEKAELQECTFHPEIHDAPAFVRQIAQARSEAHVDTTHCGHHDWGKRRDWTGVEVGPTTTGGMVFAAGPLRYT